MQSVPHQVRRMQDVFSNATRSEVMSCIRSHGNKDTEQRLAAVFREHELAVKRENV